MDAATTALIGVLAGTLLGSGFGVVTTLIQARESRRVAKMQIEAQVILAQQQHDHQITQEKSTRHRERLQESYRHLMRWLDDIQTAMEQVHGASYSGDQRTLTRTLEIVDEWPYETLRPPQDTAETRYLWSEAVREAMGKVFGSGAKWHREAQEVIGRQMSKKTRRNTMGVERARRWEMSERSDRPDGRAEMWERQQEVVALLDGVRDQIRRDMA